MEIQDRAAWVGMAPGGWPRAASFLWLGLSGCAVGPDYQKPETKLQEFHSAAAVEPRATGARAPDLDAWWQGFNDPMLSGLVQRAQAQNLDLAGALARVQQARGAASEAGAQLLPSADLNGQTARIHQFLESPIGQAASHLPGYNRNQSDYTLGLGASWSWICSAGCAAAARQLQPTRTLQSPSRQARASRLRRIPPTPT